MADRTVLPDAPDGPNELLTAALAYAARGWRVFPLADREKVPLTKRRGPDDERWAATTDPDQIRSWWSRWPNANIGVATGGGLLVVDVDGDQGRSALKGRHVPLTACVRTGRDDGGAHYYFTGDGRKWDPPPGVEVKGEGAYVVAPPSIHPNGTRYTWADGLSPDDVPLAPAPQWTVSTPTRPARRTDLRLPDPVDAPAATCEVSTAYGLAALRNVAAGLAALLPNTTRNFDLAKAARRIGNLVGGAELVYREAYRALWNACEANGLLADPNDGPEKTRRTLERGLADGMEHPRRAPMVRVDRRLLTAGLTDGGLRYACLLAMVGNVTQKAMADLVGVKPRTIRKWRDDFNQADEAAEVDLLQIAMDRPTRRFVSVPMALVLDTGMPLQIAVHLRAVPADRRGRRKVGRETLHERTGIPLRTLARQVAALQSAGWLTVSQAKYCGKAGRRLACNTYRLMDRPNAGAQGLPAPNRNEMARSNKGAGKPPAETAKRPAENVDNSPKPEANGTSSKTSRLGVVYRKTLSLAVGRLHDRTRHVHGHSVAERACIMARAARFGMSRSLTEELLARHGPAGVRALLGMRRTRPWARDRRRAMAA